jgi:hypothetical protein
MSTNNTPDFTEFAERKKTYLATISSAIRRSAEVIFAVAEPVERREGADLYELSNELRLEIVRNCGGVLTRGKTQYAHAIIHYAKWCAAQGYANVNIATLMYSAMVSVPAVAGWLIGSPQQLADHLDDICRPIDFESKDVIYRAAMWMTYAGMFPHELDTVRVEDYDPETHTLLGKYTLYHPDAIRAVEMCCELDVLLYYHKKYTTIISRADSDKILRLKKGVPPLWRLNNDKSREHHNAISPRRVFVSGEFHRAYLLEQRMEYPDFKAIAMRRAQWTVKGKTTTPVNSKTINADSVRGCRVDYAAWKEAFGLETIIPQLKLGFVRTPK